MSTTDVGNDYHDHAKLSWHVCARCLAWMGKGDVRWVGLTGCCFPEPDATNSHLYQEAMDAGVLKCYRCWLKNDDCVVVPKELRDEFGELNKLLRRLRDRKWPVIVDNPAFATYVAPAGGPANPPPQTIRDTHHITEDEVEMFKFKVAKICAPLAETCSRKYKPYSAHLRLHNGSLERDEAPEGDMTPSLRDRSKTALYSKNVAGKRAEEAMVEEQLKDMTTEPGTPRKKGRFGVPFDSTKADREGKRVQLQARIVELEAERSRASGAAKGKLTRDIKKLNEERDALA